MKELKKMILATPQEIDETEFREFIAEFRAANEKLVPYSINQRDFNFETLIQSLINESKGIDLADDWVPASTFFLIDNNNKILGATNIRHRLTEALKIEGGHIGYGIRPGQRSKGYGTKILKLALQKIKEMGINKILITCNKENTHSAKVITNNDGKLDSEISKDGRIVQRYWVEIT
jgi:predicted acetyltransferase